MFLSRWLRHSTPQARTAARRPHLGVEPLEAREVPAVLTVSTTADVIDPNDGALSLREAVIQANSDRGADTIVVPAGTYRFALVGRQEDAARTGDLDLTGRVTVQGAGAGATVIDAAGLDRVFHVLPGADVTLAGLAVRGGYALLEDGGGVSNGGTLAVTDCAIAGNTAAVYGGGISNWGNASLTVWGGTVSGNTATDQSGGGISNISRGRVAIAGCIISANTAPEGSGGGIYNGPSSTLSVRDSTLAGNAAPAGDGGGLFNDYGGAVTVCRCVFEGNSAAGAGGAILSWSAISVLNSSIVGNAAGWTGGGIATAGGSITNTTITDNTATDGGGVWNGGTLVIQASTITDNTATDRGGDVYNYRSLTAHGGVIGDEYDV